MAVARARTRARPAPRRRANPDWRFDRRVLAPFFAQVPDSFRKEQAAIHQAYQELLYTVEHDFDAKDLARIDRLMGHPSPRWPAGSQPSQIRLLDEARFPDAGVVAALRPVPGLSLTVASTYLHFFHHTYPIFDPDAVRGLAKLGFEIPWTIQRDPAVYADYVRAIEELRERIPFWDVPEVNVHINRILQAALSAWGRRGS